MNQRDASIVLGFVLAVAAAGLGLFTAHLQREKRKALEAIEAPARQLQAIQAAATRLARKRLTQHRVSLADSAVAVPSLLDGPDCWIVAGSGFRDGDLVAVEVAYRRGKFGTVVRWECLRVVVDGVAVFPTRPRQL